MSPSERNRESGKRRKSKRDYMQERLAANIVDEKIECGFVITVCRTAYAWGGEPQKSAGAHRDVVEAV